MPDTNPSQLRPFRPIPVAPAELNREVQGLRATTSE